MSQAVEDIFRDRQNRLWALATVDIGCTSTCLDCGRLFDMGERIYARLGATRDAVHEACVERFFAALDAGP